MMTKEQERAMEGFRSLSQDGKEAVVLFLLDLMEVGSPGFLEAFSSLLDTLGGRAKIIDFPGKEESR